MTRYELSRLTYANFEFRQYRKNLHLSFSYNVMLTCVPGNDPEGNTDARFPRKYTRVSPDRMCKLP